MIHQKTIFLQKKKVKLFAKSDENLHSDPNIAKTRSLYMGFIYNINIQYK